MVRILSAVAAVALFACGPSQSKDTTKPGGGTGTDTEPKPMSSPELTAACQGGDQVSCVKASQQTCGNNVWQLEFDNLPTIYVADNGLIRVDYFGLALIGTNSSQWLACLQQCPDSNVNNVCVPFGFDLKFAMASGGKCESSSRDIHPWNALATKSLTIDCPDQRAEVAYVPELLAVQKALVASRSIAKEDPLASVEGLMVKLSVGGDTEYALDRVSKGHCSVFGIPKGYRVIGGAQAFTDIKAMHPQLEGKFKAASNQLVQTKLSEARAVARKKINAKVRTQCTKAGKDVSTPEKLRECARNLDGIDALETAILTRETAKMVQSLTPKLEAVLRREYVKPVCEKFAPSAPAPAPAAP